MNLWYFTVKTPRKMLSAPPPPPLIPISPVRHPLTSPPAPPQTSPPAPPQFTADVGGGGTGGCVGTEVDSLLSDVESSLMSTSSVSADVVTQSASSANDTHVRMSHTLPRHSSARTVSNDMVMWITYLFKYASYVMNICVVWLVSHMRYIHLSMCQVLEQNGINLF